MKRLDTESSKGFKYQLYIPELEKYYQKQYDMIKEGNTDLVTLELVMLGHALDFINMVKKQFGFVLNSEEKSINSYEEVMDALSRGILNVNLFDKENNIAEKAGAYLGFLIIANVGGEWTDTENGTAVVIKGREIYVFDFAEKRLMSGSELNAAEYYKAIKTLKSAKPTDNGGK